MEKAPKKFPRSRAPSAGRPFFGSKQFSSQIIATRRIRVMLLGPQRNIELIGQITSIFHYNELSVKGAYKIGGRIWVLFMINLQNDIIFVPFEFYCELANMCYRKFVKLSHLQFFFIVCLFPRNFQF